MEEIKKVEFNELGLSPKVIKAIEDMGFEEPSSIQKEVIPVLMDGYDAIGQAQTGTGKTLAFGAPLISTLGEPKGHVAGIVLCPTRELAVQVNDELNRIAAKTKLKIIPVFGGAPIDRQMRMLKEGADIVVGTPGRVIDLMERRKLDLSGIEFFILDEADEMLNMGFIEDIEKIMESAPEDRQTMLFSATMPKRIKDLSRNFMKEDRKHIIIERSTVTVDKVEQYYYEIKHQERFESLCRILDSTDYNAIIIFCNTKRSVDEVTEHLKNRGYKAEGMHGDMKQEARLKTLGRFKNGTLEILVATDVAARGIDVDNISHVVNYDLPQDTENYVHRIGRTGRAGRNGVALTLVTPREYMSLKAIEKFTRGKITRKDIPTVDDIFESKLSGIKNEIDEVLEKEDYRKFLNNVISLDDSYNLAEVAAALLYMKYKDDISFDYKDNKIGSEKHMVRLFMTVGAMDKLNPRKLLTFLTEKAGTHGNDIGNIDIAEKFTFVDVAHDKAEEIIRNCSGEKFCGRKLAIEISSGESRGRGRRNTGRRDDRRDPGKNRRYRNTSKPKVID